jgi:transcriptional regulator with XRE-family HTH domain
VSDLERGHRDPKLSTIFAIAGLLGIPAVALCRETERNYARLTGGNSASPE